MVVRQTSMSKYEKKFMELIETVVENINFYDPKP